MSIPANTGKAHVTYEGNGTTSLFLIPFAFSTPGEIAVYVNGAPASGVTVFGAGDPFGGVAAFAAAPATGSAVRIRLLQTVHVSPNDSIAGSLTTKLVAGNGIQLTEIGDGGDERLEIAATGAGSAIPVGTVSAYAGNAAPEGWLLCDGAAVDRIAYADLFGIIGATYGAGDGSTTFNLPDLRGRVAAGKDDMGGVAADRLTASSAAALDGSLLGASGGSQQHQLTVAEMPSHSHPSGGDLVNTVSGTTNVLYSGSRAGWGTSSTGGNQPHNNVQPTLILNYIIKA